MVERGRALELVVPGMTCRHCIRTVTARLRDVDGLNTVEADALTGWVLVRGTMAAADVLAALRACGFPGEVVVRRRP